MGWNNHRRVLRDVASHFFGPLFDDETAEPPQEHIFSGDHRLLYVSHKCFHNGLRCRFFYPGLMCDQQLTRLLSFQFLFYVSFMR